MKKYFYSYDFSKNKLSEYNFIEPDLSLYEKLLTIQSPSGNEGDMIKFLKSYIFKNFKNVEIEQDELGSLYITKGVLPQNSFYPCLVAHLDEVHKLNPDRIITKVGDFFIGWDNKLGERVGIGADDKNGIFIALTMLHHFDTIKLFFPVQEEIGIVGTSKCDLDFFLDIGYLIQCDRRGNSDFITYTNGINVTSEEFIQVNSDLLQCYEYVEGVGSCTDIGELVRSGVGVSACNISCGYWDEHTNDEMTHIPSLINCLNLVYHILLRCKLTKFEFTYVKSVYSKSNYCDEKEYAKYSYEDGWNYGVEEEYEHPCVTCKIFDCMNCKIFE